MALSARTLLLLLALMGVGCLGEPPRTNPLDPLADTFADEGRLEGRVTTLYAPFLGLDSARVELQADAPGLPDLATRTDAAGRFALRAVPTGRYTVVATRRGYGVTTDTLTVGLGRLVQRDLRLNGQPQIQSVQARTQHISRWFPIDDFYRLDLDVEATDPDGLADLTSLDLVFPGLSARFALQPTLTPGLFSARLPAEQLPGGSLPGLLGQPYFLEAADRAGAVAATLPQTLVRVIEPTPVALRPQNLDAAEDATPLLTWEPLALPYPFTYRLDVVRVEVNVETLAWVQTGLPVGTTQFAVTTPLAPGTYYWTVAVVDAFGNLSRSKEAGFRVL